MRISLRTLFVLTFLATTTTAGATRYYREQERQRRTAAAFVNVRHAKLILEDQEEGSPYADRRTPEMAIELCNDAIRLCPEFRAAYAVRAVALERAGQVERAAKDRAWLSLASHY